MIDYQHVQLGADLDEDLKFSHLVWDFVLLFRKMEVIWDAI